MGQKYFVALNAYRIGSCLCPADLIDLRRSVFWRNQRTSKLEERDSRDPDFGWGGGLEGSKNIEVYKSR